MFSNGYAVAIVVNGNVVESRQDGVVAIPFGADYSIRLINRNGKRAMAKISIDGENVTSGGIIVDKYSYQTIERSTKKAVTFRFASVNSQAAVHSGKAGNDVDGSKGLITVEWQEEYHNPYNYPNLSSIYDGIPRSFSLLATPTSSSYTMNAYGATGEQAKYCAEQTSGGINLPTDKLQSGVTVDGGHSNQLFRVTSFQTNPSVSPTVLHIKLMGYNPEEGRPANGVNYCPACRTKTHKKTDKFCRNCGEKF